MRLWPKHWHAETWICSLRGHVTPAAKAERVLLADAALGAQLADGRRLARCLRCDTWIEHEVPTPEEAAYDVVPLIADLPRPRRGKQLQEAILMRLIAANKGLHATLFGIVAILLGMIETHIGGLQSWAERVQKALSTTIGDTGQQSSRDWFGRQLVRILDIKGGALKILLFTATLYCVVEGTEAVGLWLGKRWAEYLTVIATAGFLPLEIHELTKRVTFLRLLALAVNVALLVWLIRNKRLFGLRGGYAALKRHEDEEVDWDEILASPRPAKPKPPRPPKLERPPKRRVSR